MAPAVAGGTACDMDVRRVGFEIANRARLIAALIAGDRMYDALREIADLARRLEISHDCDP